MLGVVWSSADYFRTQGSCVTPRGCVTQAGVLKFFDFSEVSGYAQVKCRSSRVKVCHVIRAELNFVRDCCTDLWRKFVMLRVTSTAHAHKTLRVKRKRSVKILCGCRKCARFS